MGAPGRDRAVPREGSKSSKVKPLTQAPHVREAGYVSLQFRNVLQVSWSCPTGVVKQ